MGKHKPCVIWPLHKVGQYPNIYLTTVDTKMIKLEFYPAINGAGISITMPRRDVRLLAKRLNQILDQTG